MTVNKVILIGNLGRDPEVRQTQSGSQVATLNIATTERRKQADGTWGDHTEWHRCVAFGRTAETAGRFLSKGRQVYIEGKLSTRKWQDKDGRDRWSTEVIIDNLRFIGGRGECGQGGGGGYGGGGGGGGYGGGGGGGYGGGNQGGGGYGGGNQGGGGGGYGGGGDQGDGGGGFDDDIPF